jgi:predicted MFS family arabinose efflux permease
MIKSLKKISEFRLILILGFVQFIDILEFMAVMPLGPDYALDFKVDITKLGFAAIGYTISAAISGVLSATFIDRFERKKAMIVVFLGLISASLIAAYAKTYEVFLFARFFAGIFGGPTTALTFAIIADLVAPERRGQVIGKVMSAFSFAATIGVPCCLYLSRTVGWREAFFGIFIIGLVVLLLIILFLPKNSNAIKHQKMANKVSFKSLTRNNVFLLAYLMSGLGLLAAFMIIPYISAYLQFNYSLRRVQIEHFYFFGGIISFITAQFMGNVVDKKGASFVGIIAIIIICLSLFGGFVFKVDIKPAYLIFIPFMAGMGMRNIANSTVITKIPSEHERAGFMSIISLFQHVFSAVGAYFTSVITLQKIPTSPLENMDLVAILAIAIFVLYLLILKIVEKKAA